MDSLRGGFSKAPPKAKEAAAFYVAGFRRRSATAPWFPRLYQATRLPVKGKEPKAPALTLPDSLSPSTAPVKSRVSGMGLEILADQLTLLPPTLPFSSGPEPCAACWVPVSVAPLVARSKVAFCAPMGELMTISHLPSTAIALTPGDLAGI